MALIKCPECGRNISDKASKCIHCGIPIKYMEPILRKPPKQKKKKLSIKTIILILIPFIIMITGYIIYQLKLQDDGIVGTWSRYAYWKEDGETYRVTYAEFVFKKNNKFSHYGYDVDAPDNNPTKFVGSYVKEGNTIVINTTENGKTATYYLYLEGNIIHEYTKNSKNYYPKGKNNTITINYKKEYITDTIYEDIINNKKDAIIVATSSYCSHCINYLETIKSASTYFKTPIYLYDVNKNSKIKVSGTPTTFIIKNGIEVDRLTGAVSLTKLDDAIYKAEIE